jgi:hypothetical protein
VDTLGHLLALVVTLANEQGRDQVEELARQVQEVTEQSVELAFVDQGYSGPAPTRAAQAHGIQLEVIELPPGQAWICTAAATLGGRTGFCLGGAFSPAGA